MSRKPRQLSGGQRQRVAVGRAIVRHPQVFLFDEPLSNLDAKLRVQMRVELKRLHDRLETTAIYVTHDQVEAMTLGDRVVVMKDGLVQQVGEPLTVYAKPRNRFVAGFIGSPAMNFIDCTVTGTDGELAVDAPGGFLIAVPAGAAGGARALPRAAGDARDPPRGRPGERPGRPEGLPDRCRRGGGRAARERDPDRRQDRPEPDRRARPARPRASACTSRSGCPSIRSACTSSTRRPSRRSTSAGARTRRRRARPGGEPDGSPPPWPWPSCRRSRPLRPPGPPTRSSSGRSTRAPASWPPRGSPSPRASGSRSSKRTRREAWGAPAPAPRARRRG